MLARTRRFFLVQLLLTIVLTPPLVALERRKPLSLDELKNKKSQYYTPIPYPKTDRELLKDLRYHVRKHGLPLFHVVRLIPFRGEPQTTIQRPHALIEAFAKGGRKGKSVRSQIIRAQSLNHADSGEYSFLIVLTDSKTGKPFLRAILNDAGGLEHVDQPRSKENPECGREEYLRSPLPYSSFADDRVKKILERYNIRVSSETARELFHAVEFANDDGSLILMHQARDGTLLVVSEGLYREYRVFTALREPCPKGLSEQELLAAWHEVGMENRQKNPGTLTLLDSVNEEFYHLTEIF